MYAVFRSGGKQYRAAKGDVLRLEKIDGDEGATVLFMFKDGRWPAMTIGNNDGSTLRSDVIADFVAARQDAAK